ncbi:MYB, putative [Entamoeba invadens IP1]|uniref:MYB, putative n=1 Tax=Entamoeba invadens IP1 TaxID=370355 RepID=A0A0A1UDA1_ENTIV|nr:MYB, putative [Entamoeba invadens IP1]ELP94398.1 MYB, putative [Entamoeba invadens IP1]|eukprot:XP_004261169.1 MYB, putative [Entamoeba invadens IP1]
MSDQTLQLTPSIESLLPQLLSQTNVQGIKAQFKKTKTILTWTKEEDEKLLKAIDLYGPNNWELVSQFIERRTKKQCKERFMNKFDPNIVKKPWTVQEDMTLLEARKVYGNRWTEIKRFLPGRSANHIKNRFFSHYADDVKGSKLTTFKSAFSPAQTKCTVVYSTFYY